MNNAPWQIEWSGDQEHSSLLIEQIQDIVRNESKYVTVSPLE